MRFSVGRLLCGLLLLPQFLLSQGNKFIASGDEPATLQSISSQCEKAFQKEISGLPKENRKELSELYQLRHQAIKSKVESKELFTGPAATTYLQRLVDEVLTQNPQLGDRPPVCFFSRSGIPNASSMGEGMILLNMGLFTRLTNESQAAFVLCHEIAHHYLRHSENSINAYISNLYSSESQKALRAIKSSHYNKRSDLEALIQKFSFDSHRHSRDHESEADSMAVELLRNTRFNLHESLTTLSLLDSIDSLKFNTESCLSKTFDAPDYPFKKKWLKETGLLGSGITQETDLSMTDSLKTHPDCKTRIQTLEPLVKKYDSPGRKNFVVDQQQFESLKTLFSYEIIEFAFTSGNYTRSLFYTLIMLEKNPHDAYLVTQVGKIFQAMFVAQRAHTLGKSIDLPSPQFPSNYNTLLQFISNLYADDYLAIGYNFLKKNEPLLQSDPSFTKVYSNLAQLYK